MEPRARWPVWPGRRCVPGIVAPDSWGARGAECLPRDVLRHTLPEELAMDTNSWLVARKSGQRWDHRGRKGTTAFPGRSIPRTAISETLSNCWKFRVINEAGCWEHLLGIVSRTSGMAA